MLYTLYIKIIQALNSFYLWKLIFKVVCTRLIEKLNSYMKDPQGYSVAYNKYASWSFFMLCQKVYAKILIWFSFYTAFWAKKPRKFTRNTVPL